MMGPGLGFFEIVVLAVLALIVVGPKDLPLLVRKVSQSLNKMRAMAGEFRASFDDLARQAELDQLRRNIDDIRHGRIEAYPAPSPASPSHGPEGFSEEGATGFQPDPPPMRHGRGALREAGDGI